MEIRSPDAVDDFKEVKNRKFQYFTTKNLFIFII